MPDTDAIDAVVVAAGSSTRFGQDKLTAVLAGRPLLAWTLDAFADARHVRCVVLVTAPGREAELGGLAATWTPALCVRTVAGGARRRDSVEAGLRQCSSRYVAIHDGARPLVSTALVTRAIAAATGHPGAIPVVPVIDSLKELGDGRVVGHLDRTLLAAAQTPQVVLRQAWLDAAAAGDDDETDDAAMLARLGLECVTVEGEPENIKVTRPIDLELARLILAQRRGSQ